MKPSSFVIVLLWICLCTVAHASICEDEDCDMRNEYDCEDKRCHKYSFCNSVNRKCECPIVGAVTTIKSVCGTDSSNYSSEVELHRKACLDYSDLEVMKRGPCKDQSNVERRQDIDDDEESDNTGVVVPVIITCIVVAVLVILGWLYYQKRTKNKFTINKRGSDKKDLLTML